MPTEAAKWAVLRATSMGFDLFTSHLENMFGWMCRSHVRQQKQLQMFPFLSEWLENRTWIALAPLTGLMDGCLSSLWPAAELATCFPTRFLGCMVQNVPPETQVVSSSLKLYLLKVDQSLQHSEN